MSIWILSDESGTGPLRSGGGGGVLMSHPGSIGGHASSHCDTHIVTIPPGDMPSAPPGGHGIVPTPATLHGPQKPFVRLSCVHMHFVSAEEPFAKHCARVMSPVVSSQAETSWSTV